MGAGKKKLERALSAFSNSKISKPVLVPGALGGYIDGYQQIEVGYRQDFVYVRLRTTDSETIQAFNDKVGIHWDLPVLVYRDPESPGVWRIYGRDIRAYDDWEGAAYNNPHGESHSFAGAAKTGADVVWTFKRQYMPLLMHPNPTGTMGVYIEPDFYLYQGSVRWWPGSGSASLAALKPTGSFTARFVTVYLNSAGNPDFLGGDEFSSLDVPTDPSSYIRIPSTTQGVPLGAVLLLTGTEYIGWGEIYDLRLPNQAVFPMSDVSGSLMFYDEATLQGSAPRLNVTGERLTVRVSGSYATIHASPDPVEQIGVFNVIAPPGSALGTGTVIEWGDNLTATISGTTVHIDATAGGGVAHVFPGGALVIPDRYPTMFTWTGSANDAHTNNAVWEDILNLSGQFVLDNVSDVLFELMISTSCADSNWNHQHLRVVLDTTPLNPAFYYTRDANEQNLEMFLAYHAVEKNVASGAHSVEAQWFTTSNVNVNIQSRRLSVIAATGGLSYNSGTAAIGVLDEGVYLGAGNIFNFRGQNVEVTISGSAVDVFVTGSSGGGGHETGTLVVYDENVFLGVFEEMRFLGAGVDAYNSGSYVSVSIPGGGGVTVNTDGIMGWDEGIPLGTGSVLNVTGDGASLSISGTVLELNVPGPFLQDDGFPLGYLSAIDFVGAGVTATLLGSQATITIPGGGGGAGGVDQIGIYGLDEGVPLGTGTWVNFRGPNVEATISGTVIDVYVSGSSGGGGHQTGTMVVYDENTFLGVFEEMRFIGDGVQALNSGSYAAISIPGGGSTFAGVDQIGIYGLDEGVPVGTGTWVDFGPGFDITISGTVIHVDTVPAAGEENWYLYETGSDVAGYEKLLLNRSFGPKVTETATITTVTGAVDQWLTDPTYPGVDFFPAGIWTAHMHAAKTAGTKSVRIFGQFIRRTHPGGVETALGYTQLSTALTAAETPYTLEWVSDTAIEMDTTDRFGLKVLAVTAGGGTNPQVALYYEGDTSSRATIPVAAGAVVALTRHQEDGVPKGDARIFDWGDNIDISISGTVVRVDATGGGGGHQTGTMVIYDEGTFLGVFEEMRFIGGGVNAYNSGSYAAVSIPGGGGVTVSADGIMGLDDGVPVGTGTWLNARNSLDLSISGTTLAMDVRLLPRDVYQGSGTFTFPAVFITGSGDELLTILGTEVFYGAGTVPAYFTQGAGNNLQINTNVSRLNAVADATKSQWKLVLGAALDEFSLRRSPIGGTYVEATLLSLGGSGNFHVRNGMYLSDVPGAYMGSGTINARQYYKDGVPLSAGPAFSENGVLLGTPSNIDVRMGLNATFSGTNVQLDSGRYWMDRTFSASGSPFDYDFDTATLERGWLITGGSVPPPPYDLNASWPSWLHVTFSGSQTLSVFCDVAPIGGGGLFTPASGSFSVTIHATWSCDAVANKNLNLEIDNARVGAARNSMRMLIIRGDPPVARLDKTVAGSDTYNLGNRNYYDSGGEVYVHIERVGTGSWGGALSADGMGWHPITALQSQYFGDLCRIKINLSNTGGGIFGWGPWGVDWVRVNHLFMFTRP